MQILRSVITGTGSFIPSVIKTNRDFTIHNFYAEDNKRIETDPAEVVEKFESITGIAERRYATEEVNASEMGIQASRLALADANCDPETIDQIIVAHNFGNVLKHTIQTDAMPALASRVKKGLGINNPSCIPYDVLFGCPGWIQGVIQADSYFKSGLAKKCLVIGTETLSRVLDMYDRDSMIFSDGAGAVVMEYKEVQHDEGILSLAMQAHCNEETDYLYMGKSNYPDSDPRVRYIKMKGRKVYEYAMKYVPQAMKQCLDKSGVELKDLKKVFLHQANEKMDEGIIKAMYKLYGEKNAPDGIMPMSIHKLGNSSVATVPTLLDMVRRNEMPGHAISAGDVIMFASVGAGMNINAVCYRV
ncbi:MAG: 3-oxoacyl-[acyl-carrier-protein] synthase III C-terminal domain-containing protein [Ferruginibacter sp.]